MEGFSKIGFDIPLLISQLISFIILLVILYFGAYKKVLNILDERSKKVKESLEEAQTLKDRSLKAEDEIKAQIKEASLKGQEIVGRATKAGEEIRLKAQDQAKKDADSIIEKAKTAIEAERDSAIDELRKEFGELTILAAGKVIGETLDSKSHKELIDKVLEESQTLKKAN